MSFPCCSLFIVIVVRYALPELQIHSSCLKWENMCWSIIVIRLLVACLLFILAHIFSSFFLFLKKTTYCCRTDYMCERVVSLRHPKVKCLSIRTSSVKIISFCDISLSKMSLIQTMYLSPISVFIFNGKIYSLCQNNIISKKFFFSNSVLNITAFLFLLFFFEKMIY